MSRFLILFLLFPAVSGGQENTSTRKPAVFLSQAGWVRKLIKASPAKIVIDPDHPDSPLYVYQDPDPKSPTHGVKFCWLSLPKSSTAMAVTNVLRAGMADEIYQSARADSDIVIMNGGFFGYGNKKDFVPVGLVIASGRKTSERKNWSSGGFVLQIEGKPKVVPVKEFRMQPGIEHAVQSKPMLIQNSRVDIKSDPAPPFNRSAVAVDRAGAVIVAGAFSENGDAVTLIEFGQFLAIPRSEGGPGAVVALNLDGGPDAHLYFPKIKLHLGYGGQNFVPDVIHFSVR
jgi:uncharacterized protein YigE (DUF2233 family)